MEVDEDEDKDEVEDAPIDALNDPLHQTAESLFNPADDSDQSDTEEDTDVEDTLPPAFEEHPSIRNAYICTFAMHAFGGITKVVVCDQLVMVAALAAGIDNQTQGLGNVARTLTTLKCRLGIRTSRFIKYCFICDCCWY